MELYIIFFALLMALVGVIGLIGNIIVIIIYIYDKRLKSYTNYFFINLSAVDIIIVLVCLPVGLMDLLNEGAWILGEFICHIQHFVEGSLISVSSLTLISISIERFYAISRPLKAKCLIKKRSTIIVLICAWIISIISSSPLVQYTKFQYVNLTDNANQTESVTLAPVPSCYNDRSSTFPMIYQSTLTSIFLFAPTFILTVLYILIVLKLRRLNKMFADENRFERKNEEVMRLMMAKSSGHPNMKNGKNTRSSSGVEATIRQVSNASNYSQLISKRKQTITICLVSLAFFFCQIPIKCFQIFNSFYKFKNVSHEQDMERFKIMNIIFLSTKLLFYLHTMSNPIIYNLMSSKFSQSFRNVILCKSLNEKSKQRSGLNSSEFNRNSIK